MTKRQIGLGAVIVILIVVGAVVALRRSAAPSAPARIESGVTIVKPNVVVAAATAPATSKAPQVGGLWVRPPAKVAAKQFRRSGFAWILRQLGASEKLLDRLTDGEVAAVLTLKAQAHAGEPAAINILGEIAHQWCYLARDDVTLGEYEGLQLTNAQALPGSDLAWFSGALRADVAYDREFIPACKKLIDQDKIQSWVVGRASQGDGASLWLLSNLLKHGPLPIGIGASTEAR